MLLLPTALAAPTWLPVGPERGHVIDVAVRGDEVLAVTRAGVLRTKLDLARWERDPRFPARVRLLATDGDRAWIATDAGLWRLDGSTLTRVSDLPSGLAVDLAAVPGGVLLAMRGGDAGVWRYDGTLTRVLDGDPWQIAVDGTRVLVATLDRGVARADDGRSFTTGTGTASAVAWIDEAAWTAWSDGRVERDGVEACRIDAGPAISLASVHDTIWAVVDSATGPLPALYACQGAETRPVRVPPPDDDPVPFQPTGLWSLDPDRAILGSFREGPLLVDSTGFHPARAGFRATLGADAVVDGERILVAMMSSGVYGSSDQGTTWRHVAAGADPKSAPVTDTMDLLVAGERLFVLDFEGLTIGRGGAWYRTEGAAGAGSGRHSGLVELAQGEGTLLWARDDRGGLWRSEGGTWSRCPESGLLHLEGSGSELLFATTRGWERPGGTCGGVPTGSTVPADGARAAGGWVAAPGELWRGETRIATLEEVPIRAMAAREDEVLLADAQGYVRRCRETCVEAGPRLSEAPVAIGYLGDTVWALESRGTLLMAGEGPPFPPMFDAQASGQEIVANASNAVTGPDARAELGVPPWRSVGRSVEAALPPAPATLPVDPRLQEPARTFPWTKLVIGLEVLALAGVGVMVVRRRPGRRRRR